MCIAQLNEELQGLKIHSKERLISIILVSNLSFYIKKQLLLMVQRFILYLAAMDKSSNKKCNRVSCEGIDRLFEA